MTALSRRKRSGLIRARPRSQPRWPIGLRVEFGRRPPSRTPTRGYRHPRPDAPVRQAITSPPRGCADGPPLVPHHAGDIPANGKGRAAYFDIVLRHAAVAERGMGLSGARRALCGAEGPSVVLPRPRSMRPYVGEILVTVRMSGRFLRGLGAAQPLPGGSKARLAPCTGLGGSRGPEIASGVSAQNRPCRSRPLRNAATGLSRTRRKSPKS